MPCTLWSRVSSHTAAQCPAEAKHHGDAGSLLPRPHSWDLAGLPGCSGVAVDKISCIPQGLLELLGRNLRVALFPGAELLPIAFGLSRAWRNVGITSVLTGPLFSTFSCAFVHYWVDSR